MSADATIVNRITVDGVSYTSETTVAADGVVRKENAAAVAKTGQLTTRTDNNTGELTMSASHGITTGARLDIYWTEAGVKGHRRGVVVGTVSVNQVPIDLGAGDNLPTNLTNVTAQVPTEEEFLVTGNNVQHIEAKASRRGLIVFTQSDNTEILAITTPLQADAGGAYQWYTGNGITNPMAGVSVGKVYFSNGDSANTNTMIAGVGAN